jgi:hypothetical protein
MGVKSGSSLGQCEPFNVSTKAGRLAEQDLHHAMSWTSYRSISSAINRPNGMSGRNSKSGSRASCLNSIKGRYSSGVFSPISSATFLHVCEFTTRHWERKPCVLELIGYWKHNWRQYLLGF